MEVQKKIIKNACDSNLERNGVLLIRYTTYVQIFKAPCKGTFKLSQYKERVEGRTARRCDNSKAPELSMRDPNIVF